MSKSIQVAFTLAEEDLRAIDELVPEQFESRAEALRQAVRLWLAQRRQAAVDAALTKGYADVPQGDEERTWSELSVRGLADADLDW